LRCASSRLLATPLPNEPQALNNKVEHAQIVAIRLTWLTLQHITPKGMLTVARLHKKTWQLSVIHVMATCIENDLEK
jgi:hypothetical protein